MMDKPMLESRLKLYKQNKAEVVTALQRIEVWEKALKEGNLWLFENSVSRMMGMPRASGYTSGTELAVESREVAVETVREWIEEDKSRVYYKKLETEQIGTALESLTNEQRHVIELKYFNGMSWRNIEISFNDHFSVGRVYVQSDAIRKINKDALTILWIILGPLFSKYIYIMQAN